jgi:predicted mannosyl-3-phosphoglycerate phosphatase (HAD superfamily)
MPRTICLDFDGVLNTYSGWKGEDYLFEPQPGAKEFINELRSLGYEVVIHSTRDPMKIGKWLVDHAILGPIKVFKEKPPAIAYLDDRAIRFDGDFGKSLEEIKNFKTYWENNHA